MVRGLWSVGDLTARLTRFLGIKRPCGASDGDENGCFDLFCGAGPVGLSLAAQLHALGVSCQIFDKNECRSDQSKAFVVWGRSLELLDTCMDAHEFVTVGRPVRKARFYRAGRPFAELDFTTQKSEFGTGVLIPQSATERLLEGYLSECDLVVQRSTELLSFEQGDHDVTCVLREAKGGTENRSCEISGRL